MWKGGGGEGSEGEEVGVEGAELVENMEVNGND